MGGGSAAAADRLIGEGDKVIFRKAFQNGHGAHHVVDFAQGHGALFQLAVLFRPDVGGAVLFIGNEGGGNAEACCFPVSGVQLHIQMLAHHQALGGVQLHIEGVFAGIGHFVGAAAAAHDDHAAVLVVFADGVFVVHQSHRSGPGSIGVRPGDDLHLVSLPEAAALQFAQNTLDTVRAHLLNGDVRQGLSGLLIGAAFGNGLDPALDRGGHSGVFQEILGLLDLAFLGLGVDLRLFQVHLGGLNLDGVLQLCRAAHVVAFLLHLGNLGFIVLNGGQELFQLQLLLVQGQLQFLGVVGEQRLPFLYILAFLHEKFLDGLLGVLLDFRDVLRHNHPAEGIPGGDAADSSQVPNGLNIHRGIAAAGGKGQDKANRQTQGHPLFQFHILSSCSVSYALL